MNTMIATALVALLMMPTLASADPSLGKAIGNATGDAIAEVAKQQKFVPLPRPNPLREYREWLDDALAHGGNPSPQMFCDAEGKEAALVGLKWRCVGEVHVPHAPGARIEEAIRLYNKLTQSPQL